MHWSRSVSWPVRCGAACSVSTSVNASSLLTECVTRTEEAGSRLDELVYGVSSFVYDVVCTRDRIGEYTCIVASIGARSVRGSGPPQKFGCGVFYGWDPHEIFTKINLMSLKSTPRRLFKLIKVTF